MQLDPEALADIVINAVETACGPLLERLAAADVRIAALEQMVTKDTTRLEGYSAFQQRDLVALSERVAVLGVKLEPLGDIRADIGRLETKDHTISERVAVLETRPVVPGPAGQDGAAGKDGADGLGFDDIDLVVDDARKGCFLRFMRGDQTKEFRLPTPFDIGPYRSGEHYEKGNGVSYASSWWIAKAPTMAKPGDGATEWRLAVKRGQDGKDGKDAEKVAVVSVGRR